MGCSINGLRTPIKRKKTRFKRIIFYLSRPSLPQSNTQYHEACEIQSNSNSSKEKNKSNIMKKDLSKIIKINQNNKDNFISSNKINNYVKKTNIETLKKQFETSSDHKNTIYKKNMIETQNNDMALLKFAIDDYLENIMQEKTLASHMIQDLKQIIIEDKYERININEECTMAHKKQLRYRGVRVSKLNHKKNILYNQAFSDLKLAESSNCASELKNNQMVSGLNFTQTLNCSTELKENSSASEIQIEETIIKEKNENLELKTVADKINFCDNKLLKELKKIKLSPEEIQENKINFSKDSSKKCTNAVIEMKEKRKLNYKVTDIQIKEPIKLSFTGSRRNAPEDSNCTNEIKDGPSTSEFEEIFSISEQAENVEISFQDFEPSSESFKDGKPSKSWLDKLFNLLTCRSSHQ